MRTTLVMLITALLLGCGTYKGNEIWRRNSCNRIVDLDERAKCVEEVTRPQKEYQRDVEAAKGLTNE